MSEPKADDAWLGLLKWSLNHVDGTVPSEESPGFTEMSAEDKAFLEEVMKNGIIDEGKRMQTILSSLVSYLDNLINDNNKNAESADDCEPISESDVLDLLEELQYIVGQIDYARNFAAMGGIKFLIGCSSQKQAVSKSIRSSCLGIIATLCQNNPPVQYMMLEQGCIPKLLELYFAQDTISLEAKVMQAMASFIRDHDIAEKIFCMNEDAVKMIESGLGLFQRNEVSSESKLTLKRRTLFFLQAIVTSDTADFDRLLLFKRAIQYTACNFLEVEKESNQEIREMTLSMLVRILVQKKSVNTVLDLKSVLVGIGVKRVSAMRVLTGEEKEYATEELNLWETLISDIARTPVGETNNTPSQPSAESKK